jgi:hypothetical protein
MKRKKALALDARLDAEIPALRQPAAGGPGLWNRIEAALEAEKFRGAAAAAMPREAPATHRRSFGGFRNLGKRWVLFSGAAARFIALAAVHITGAVPSRNSDGPGIGSGQSGTWPPSATQEDG